MSGEESWTVAAVLTLIGDRPGITAAELAAGVGVNGGIVGAYLRALSYCGLIERKGSGKRTDPHRLYLAEAAPPGKGSADSQAMRLLSQGWRLIGASLLREIEGEPPVPQILAMRSHLAQVDAFIAGVREGEPDAFDDADDLDTPV